MTMTRDVGKRQGLQLREVTAEQTDAKASSGRLGGVSRYFAPTFASVFALATLVAVVVRAVRTVDPYWDTLAYHWPYAARIAGLCDRTCFELSWPEPTCVVMSRSGQARREEGIFALDVEWLRTLTHALDVYTIRICGSRGAKASASRISPPTVSTLSTHQRSSPVSPIRSKTLGLTMESSALSHSDY